MKNIILTIAFILTLGVINAQETEKTKSTLNPYLAIGLSVPNTNDFNTQSYPSVELGIMKDNLSFGLILGRNNLDGMFETNDSFNNYYYEGKVAVSFPIGSVEGYGLLGAGSYINPNYNDIFLEYGVGISKSFKKFSAFAQVSNWDGVTYITPGISFNL